MRTLLLINPKSGKEKKKKIVKKTIIFCQKNNIDLTIKYSRFPGDLTSIVNKKASQYDYLLVSGGDGTVNEVINGLMKLDKKPILAIIPSGTVNDIAKILKIPKSINQNLKMIFKEKSIEKIDINKINDKYFLYVAASGYLTSISYDVNPVEKKILGKTAYVKRALELAKETTSHKIEVFANNEKYLIDASFSVLLSANQFGGLHLPMFDKKCKLNDGLIELRVFESKKNIFLRIIRFIISFGKKRKDEISINSNHFIIKSKDNDDLNWNCDGENKESNDIEITVLNKAFSIVVNKKVIKKYFR